MTEKHYIPFTLSGTSDPASDAGKNGDFYVKYVDGTPKTVSAMYNKIDGSWLKSSTGGSGGGKTYTLSAGTSRITIQSGIGVNTNSYVTLVSLPLGSSCSGKVTSVLSAKPSGSVSWVGGYVTKSDGSMSLLYFHYVYPSTSTEISATIPEGTVRVQILVGAFAVSSTSYAVSVYSPVLTEVV